MERYLEAGFYSYSFNGENLPSGVYFYEIIAGKFKDIKRMLLISKNGRQFKSSRLPTIAFDLSLLAKRREAFFLSAFH